MSRLLIWTHLLLACCLLLPPPAAAADGDSTRGSGCCCAARLADSDTPRLLAPRCGTPDRDRCPCSSPAPLVPRPPELPTAPSHADSQGAALAFALAHAPVVEVLAPCAARTPWPPAHEHPSPPLRDLLGVRLI
ncbi:MAG: hypothetical protein H6825_05720 [Planctomycetes bacterium]|nr:hypothetical protein [Planctomycetota bacterium]